MYDDDSKIIDSKELNNGTLVFQKIDSSNHNHFDHNSGAAQQQMVFNQPNYLQDDNIDEIAAREQ